MGIEGLCRSGSQWRRRRQGPNNVAQEPRNCAAMLRPIGGAFRASIRLEGTALAPIERALAPSRGAILSVAAPSSQHSGPRSTEAEIEEEIAPGGRPAIAVAQARGAWRKCGYDIIS